MLVLGRRVNQTISIGKDIQITVLEIVGNEVKLGIAAPREVPVFRSEVIQDVKEENRRAVRSGSAAARQMLANLSRPNLSTRSVALGDQHETIARG